MSWLDGVTDSMDMSLGRLWELVIYREVWHTAVHGVTKSQTSATELNWATPILLSFGFTLLTHYRYIHSYLFYGWYST